MPCLAPTKTARLLRAGSTCCAGGPEEGRKICRDSSSSAFQDIAQNISGLPKFMLSPLVLHRKRLRLLTKTKKLRPRASDRRQVHTLVYGSGPPSGNGNTSPRSVSFLLQRPWPPDATKVRPSFRPLLFQTKQKP
jgi:hypothetical protein